MSGKNIRLQQLATKFQILCPLILITIFFPTFQSFAGSKFLLAGKCLKAVF
jgi:hypothetical protein